MKGKKIKFPPLPCSMLSILQFSINFLKYIFAVQKKFFIKTSEKISKSERNSNSLLSITLLLDKKNNNFGLKDFFVVHTSLIFPSCFWS